PNPEKRGGGSAEAAGRWTGAGSAGVLGGELNRGGVGEGSSGSTLAAAAAGSGISPDVYGGAAAEGPPRRPSCSSARKRAGARCSVLAWAEQALAPIPAGHAAQGGTALARGGTSPATPPAAAAPGGPSSLGARGQRLFRGRGGRALGAEGALFDRWGSCAGLG